VTYTILLTLEFAPSWLALGRDERTSYRGEHVLPIFGRYADRVGARLFDNESFHADFSDSILLETEHLEHYFLLAEELRDCPLLTEGHVRVLESFISVENGFRTVPEAAAALAR
jgi:hypothetical protein